MPPIMLDALQLDIVGRICDVSDPKLDMLEGLKLERLRSTCTLFWIVNIGKERLTIRCQVQLAVKSKIDHETTEYLEAM